MDDGGEYKLTAARFTDVFAGVATMNCLLKYYRSDRDNPSILKN